MCDGLTLAEFVELSQEEQEKLASTQVGPATCEECVHNHKCRAWAALAQAGGPGKKQENEDSEEY